MDLNGKEFRAILKANGVVDEVSEVVTRSAPELKGSHMASLIEFATVKFVNESKDPLELFVKKTISMGNEIVDKNFVKMTSKEGRFLTEFVDDMKKFCKAKTGKDTLLEGLFPHVYHCDADVIIMENLVKKNYAMLDKIEKQDLATAKLILKRLAHFHGVSYGMNTDAGGKSAFEEKYDYLEDLLITPESRPMMDHMFDSNISLTCNILEKAGHQELCDRIKKLNGTCFTEMLRIAHEITPIFPVVTHGDFWTNNFMLRAGVQGSEREVIFVDLQGANVNSPNLDIVKYLFTSVKPEIRKHWKELLQFYYENLKSTVLALGLEFPHEFEAFVQDFRERAKLGFLIGLLLIIAFEAMGDHDTDKANESGEDFTQSLTNLLAKWVEENPDKSAKVCAEVQEVLDDYLLMGTL